MLDSFVGSDFVKQNIQTALLANRLSNSILVCGDDGLGRGLFARLLAADYLYPDNDLQAKSVANGISPEVLVVEGTGASGQISIEAIRSMRQEIFETSLSAHGRVVIVKNAHMLNQSSANALLKVLEEPPNGVLFILSAKSAQTVIPTIRSRCGIYSLTAPRIDQCCEYLLQNSKDIKTAELLSAVFCGKIGLCKQCLGDKKKMLGFETALKIVQAIANSDEYILHCIFAKHEKEKQQISEILMQSYQILAAIIAKNTDSLPDIPNAQVSQAAKHIQDTLFSIKQNVNIKLCLTALAASFG